MFTNELVQSRLGKWAKKDLDKAIGAQVNNYSVTGR